MTRYRPQGSDADRPHYDSGCDISISIEARGDVIINNCCTPEREPPPQPQPPSEDNFPPQGACMPVVPGAKHKQSRDHKLANLAAGTRVPSALAAGAMHLMRRFLAGRSPANLLEQTVNNYIDLLHDHSVTPDSPEVRQAQGALYASENSGDKLSQKIADAREEGEKALLIFLNRKSIRG